MPQTLLLQQEVLLLALRDKEGTFSSSMYLYAVAGAMVSELMLQGRIICSEDDKKTVTVVDASHTGNDVLDELLDQMESNDKPKGLRDWVFAASKIKQLNHRIAESLCELGVLKQDERKILFVFSQRIYPELDGTWEDSIRKRMADIMFFPESKADPRTGVLIAFSHHAGLLTNNFAKEELRQHKDRIAKLAEGEYFAAEATKSAIQAVQTALMVATTVPILVATTVNH